MSDVPAVASFSANGTRYVGAFQVARVTGGPEWIAAIVMPEDEVLQVVYENRRYAITLALVSLGIAIVLGSFLSHRVSVPLDVVARDLERIGRFELSDEPSPSSFVKEIAVVAESVDRMKAGLRSFSHYAPTEVVGDLLAQGEEARLGAEYRRLTIHFSDVEGFTRIGEQMEPDRLVAHIERVPGRDDDDPPRASRRPSTSTSGTASWPSSTPRTTCRITSRGPAGRRSARRSAWES